MMRDADAGPFLRWLRGEGQAPRTLIAFAHPDDETIGAGAVLARLPRVRLLCATEGAPHDRHWWGDPSCVSRQDYAALRRREMEAALAAASVPPDGMIQLSHPDQGLLRLYTLRLEGRTVAVHYGFMARGRAYYYIGGFDPGIPTLSPGNLVVEHAIRQAVREGAREFDFPARRRAVQVPVGRGGPAALPPPPVGARGGPRMSTTAPELTLQLPVTLREAREEDVEALEWYGIFTAHRESIQDAWRRHQAGDNVMIVAEMNGHPIGQAWMDLARHADESAGLLWAVRSVPAGAGDRRTAAERGGAGAGGARLSLSADRGGKVERGRASALPAPGLRAVGGAARVVFGHGPRLRHARRGTDGRVAAPQARGGEGGEEQTAHVPEQPSSLSG